MYLRGIVSVLIGFFGVAASGAEPVFHLTWPPNWEYQPPRYAGASAHLIGRQRQGNRVTQELRITFVDLRRTERPVSAESVRSLAEQLRDAMARTAREQEIPLVPLRDNQGYYFKATDRHYQPTTPGQFKQLVEGIYVDAGYLVNFTLLTNSDENDLEAVLDAIRSATISEGSAHPTSPAATPTPPR